MRETLCWTCNNNMCSWAQRLMPVKGWTAEKTKLRSTRKGTYTESYRVIKCPKYFNIKNNLSNEIMDIFKTPQTLYSVIALYKDKRPNEIKAILSSLVQRGLLCKVGANEKKQSLYVRYDYKNKEVTKND